MKPDMKPMLLFLHALDRLTSRESDGVARKIQDACRVLKQDAVSAAVLTQAVVDNIGEEGAAGQRDPVRLVWGLLNHLSALDKDALRLMLQDACRELEQDRITAAVLTETAVAQLNELDPPGSEPKLPARIEPFNIVRPAAQQTGG